jgi:hypothetical protein
MCEIAFTIEDGIKGTTGSTLESLLSVSVEESFLLSGGSNDLKDWNPISDVNQHLIRETLHNYLPFCLVFVG